MHFIYQPVKLSSLSVIVDSASQKVPPPPGKTAIFSVLVNQLKLVNMSGYKVATHWQNFREIYSVYVKILQKV